MQDLTIRQLYQAPPTHDQPETCISGWVRTVRDSKAFAFIALHDGSYFLPLQIVVESDRLVNFREVAKLNVGSAIRVVGTLTLTPGMKQPFELKADTVEIVGVSTSDYPLQKKAHSMEYLRT
ncbi:MAG: OB-fold nucleic acid binding domain-containing protein, partial [Clostridia bacterium]